MNVADYWREQSRKRRAKARETGRCIICMTRPARPDRVTCERCCAAATAATRRRRRPQADDIVQLPAEKLSA
ncbi:MAG TPA: hypothetical protein VEJ20_04765 [Candidatus Eremiobacteraceae bacterium]|nr:hypothetical protein [Candidatus Eremiobacteraceae bacterium]